jgi:phospholipase C
MRRVELSPRRSAVLLVACLIVASCGSRHQPATMQPGTGSSGGSTQFRADHVFLVLEENHSFDETIGNSAMPYFNGLASKYGLAAQYFADTHPSIGNYFMLTTGVIETNDDTFTGVVSDDNIIREFKKARISWKSYAESLPTVGYTGGDEYPYLRRHNPFSYLSDVLNDDTEAVNLVSFSQFASDLSKGTLPTFSYIVPNAVDDAHDGTLANADLWLQQNIEPLVDSTTFQNNGLLIVTFDEADDSDSSHGGGHIATLIICPKGKLAFQSQVIYRHESVLRLVLSSLGVSTFPGASATATSMEDFFR